MEKFWIEDYKELFKKDNLFPKKQMSRNEILNSLTKYSILIFIFFIFVRSRKIWLCLPIIIIGYCILIYYIDLERSNNEIINNENSNITCEKPSINNPFMNILATENNVKKPACLYKDINKDSDKKYKYNLYQNLYDIFDNQHSKRQFYTMPVTTIPNKQKDFAEWLYKTDGNCKENNVRCLIYEDERHH